jgi:hypothetical protein
MKRIVLFACVLCCVGCSTPQHTWPNNTRDVVWTAMVAAANAPDYDAVDPRKRWIVMENLVDDDASRGNIKVRRSLARSLLLPLQNEQVDQREWFFSIQLLQDNPPTATFDSVRTTIVPARLLDEANRFFNTVDDLLQSSQD